MNWVETSPGTFSNDLNGVEKIYRRISLAFKPSGRENGGIYCICNLGFGPLFGDNDYAIALRNAWKALRFDFPGLAVVPEGFDKTSYVLPNESLVEKWANETFIVERTTDPEDIITRYPLRDLPSMYFFPTSSQILLLISHWRIDGLGICMLLDRFFSLLAAGTPAPAPESWVNDLHKISPSIEDAAGTPNTVDPELEAFARAYIENHHQNAVNVAGLPCNGDATTPPGNFGRAAIKFDQFSSAAFVASCKIRNISVTAAVYAALADWSYHAVQTYVTGVTSSVARTSNFQQKAQQLTAFSKAWYSEKFMRAFRLTAQYHAEALFKPRPHGAQPPSGIHLSSLGVVENYLPRQYGNTIRVTDFQLGVNMMTRQRALYTWTFEHRLSLSVVYNDAYHDQAAAQVFLESIVGVLEKEIGIALTPEHNIKSDN
ncbi:hypothetical protein B0O99DRAFT_530755 [Bisporella sp. PMI_857]|nr:hypothetical protein B0O99DRAFT_530755 [Bisporella sp. PMI_857]